MSPRKTAPSTPRLSEYARKFVFPSGRIQKTVWPRVEEKGRELGLGFDWWQSQLGTVCLGYDDRGKYVATVGGVGLSIPRQVGKTYFVLALLVIMCILFPGLQVVWTAHHLRTSTKTFTTLRGICRRRKVQPHIKALRSANGEQQAEFVNGSMIMFGSRARGFGRGFDEVDVEVFDEAQILDTKSLEDMIAATNQARHEHGALLFFMGTPPRPTDPSDAFTARRADAWAGTADDSIWLEISADPKSGPDDRSQWSRMNPSYPKRTPVESMLRLRKNLADEDSWNREGRGIWDELESGDTQIFGPGVWAACAAEVELPEHPAAIGVAVAVDRSCASIACAVPIEMLSDPDDPESEPFERMLLATVDQRDGVRWLYGFHHEGCPADCTKHQDGVLQGIQRRHPDAVIVIDEKGPTGDLLEDFGDHDIGIEPIGINEYAEACSRFYDKVREGRVAHTAAPVLDAAVKVADWRYVGDRRVWGRRKSDGDISMLEAATLADYGAEKFSAFNIY